MKRIRYFDLLRCVAFMVVIGYHMLVSLQDTGVYPREQLIVFFQNQNVRFDSIAVTIFFMLSGASLAVTTKDGYSVKKFYGKRLLRLLIPFYITCLVYVVYLCLKAGTIRILPPGVTRKSLVANLLGMDGFLYMNGVKVFYLGIGEWFLGCLICCYLVFPLLYFLMKKYPVVFAGLVLVLYGIVVYQVEDPNHLLLKLLEFAGGMLLGKYLPKIPLAVGLAAFVPAFLVTFGLVDVPQQIPYAARIFPVLVLLWWLFFAGLDELLNKRPLKLMDVVSSYSYELFLVHHVLIGILAGLGVKWIKSVPLAAAFEVFQLFVIIFFAAVLKFVEEPVMDWLLTAFKLKEKKA